MVLKNIRYRTSSSVCMCDDWKFSNDKNQNPISILDYCPEPLDGMLLFATDTVLEQHNHGML